MHLKIIPDIVRDQDIRGMSDQDTVLDAAKNMTKLNIGAIVVVDGDDNLVGIVTERDMTRRVMAAGLDPRATALGAAASPAHGYAWRCPNGRRSD